MFIPSEKCPVRHIVIQKGEGVSTVKDLAFAEDMYGKARMFAQMDIQPGCSIGYHAHNNETEYYYIIHGTGMFNDNGTEIPVKAGDFCSTGGGACHGMVNTGDDVLSIIGLIILE